MISKRTHIVILFFLILSGSTLFAQAVGDYRSVTTGNWSALATWQRYNGSTWVAATTAPSGTQITTVQAADSVYIDVPVSITGSLVSQGKLGGAGSLTIANGGTFELAQNNGSIPVATWATGSTCKVTGYISGSKPSNANQNFHHFTWSCAAQTANVDLGMSGNVIGGNFRVDTTGSVRVYLTSPAGYTNPITINGNVIVNGGQFSSNGSSSGASIEVTTNGNIIVNGGFFSISRGSGPDVVWTLKGDFTVNNAALQNSGGVTRTNKLLFAKAGTQNITLNNTAYGTGSSPFTMEVASGATLNMGTNVISGSNTGSFIVAAGGTVATAHTGGLAACIQSTGASNGGGNSLSQAGNYTFNGSAAQITSTFMPATVNNLSINNAAGVTLSQATTINGVLRLMAGVFNNTIPFVLGPSGSISFEGGSVLLTSVEDEAIVPQTFFVDQNYPNPFNPSTTIRFGLPVASQVTVKVFNLIGQEVATLFSGAQTAGTHTLKFNASQLGSGVYLYKIQAGTSVDVKRMLVIK